MEGFITVWRPLVEFLYFLAQILLATGLVLAYRQLSAVKQDSLLRIKRTAAEKAIEACDRYVSTCMPLIDAFYLACKEKKLASYRGPIGDFSEGSITLAQRRMATARIELTSPEFLNHLELVAAFFVSGVGDEAVAFPVIGHSFCDNIQRHYDLICLCRDGSSPDAYPNMIKLYNTWMPRKMKGDLASEKARLEKSISDIPDRKIATLEDRL